MTLALLSWNAHRTLRNTLESYKHFGLDKLFSERIIYFQEIKQVDKDIANKYGYKWMGTSENVGIAQAYKALVEKASEDIFLFLENDWVLLERPEGLIGAGKALLTMNITDVIRYRHQTVPGWPLWTLQFKDEEYERPTHLLDAVHWTDVRKFPEIHTSTIHLPPHDEKEIVLHQASSRNANWTNNPTMFRTAWLREHIVPRMGLRDVEVDLQSWWEQQDFQVTYIEPGLFTHRRIG